MEMENKTRVTIMYAIALVAFILGLLFNYFKIGSPHFQTFGSVGNWLIYLGFVGLIIATVRLIFVSKKKTTDERMEFVATKALRISFLSLIIGAFIIMIIDGIKTITIPYHMFMSYLVCGLLLIYIIAYKILLKFY
ncbi:MAG: hypothetical protein KJ559_00165 [Nanoarchaeota archaeon]|nr:hypothetical protein [Nanoarchaeota archaeon]